MPEKKHYSTIPSDDFPIPNTNEGSMSSTSLLLRRAAIFTTTNTGYHLVPQDDPEMATPALKRRMSTDEIMALSDADLEKRITETTDHIELGLVHLHRLTTIDERLLALILEKELLLIKKNIISDCADVLIQHYPEVEPSKFSLSPFKKKKENAAASRFSLLSLQAALTTDFSIFHFLTVLTDGLKYCQEEHSAYRDYLTRSIFKLTYLTLPQIKYALKEAIEKSSNPEKCMIIQAIQTAPTKEVLKTILLDTKEHGLAIGLIALTAASKDTNTQPSMR